MRPSVLRLEQRRRVHFIRDELGDVITRGEIRDPAHRHEELQDLHGIERDAAASQELRGSSHHTLDSDYLAVRVELLDFFNIDGHSGVRHGKLGSRN
jgi:hypothetical protein